jgi:hypothetical protein
MNTYEWKITSLDCYPTNEGQTVSQVYYSVSGTAGTFTGNLTGNIPLVYADAPYIAYDNLTEAIIIGWVQAALEADQLIAIKTCIDDQINNPPAVTPILPWL